MDTRDKLYFVLFGIVLELAFLVHLIFAADVRLDSTKYVPFHSPVEMRQTGPILCGGDSCLVIVITPDWARFREVTDNGYTLTVKIIGAYLQYCRKCGVLRIDTWEIKK